MSYVMAGDGYEVILARQNLGGISAAHPQRPPVAGYPALCLCRRPLTCLSTLRTTAIPLLAISGNDEMRSCYVWVSP